LGALHLEARAVERQLDPALDADAGEQRPELVADVEGVAARQDAGIDVERGNLRRAREVEWIARPDRVDGGLRDDPPQLSLVRVADLVVPGPLLERREHGRALDDGIR
jgi:hypothetical protein